MKRLIAVLVFALLPCVAQADSVSTVASELKALVDEPFKFGVARDLAGNILLAQTQVSYAGPESLELSIESVVRAITVSDNKPYVGFEDFSPSAWIQSRIAIDPNATVVITPNALYFGSVNVQETGQVPVPESGVLLLLVFGLVSLFFFTRSRVATVPVRRLP